VSDLIPIVAMLSGQPWFAFMLFSCIGICVLAPVWLIYQLAIKRRLNTGDTQALQRFHQTTEEMAARVAALERILDNDAPGWRHNPNLSGQYHGTMG